MPPPARADAMSLARLLGPGLADAEMREVVGRLDGERVGEALAIARSLQATHSPGDWQSAWKEAMQSPDPRACSEGLQERERQRARLETLRGEVGGQLDEVEERLRTAERMVQALNRRGRPAPSR